jgi:protoporphyrinogen oxidase
MQRMGGKLHMNCRVEMTKMANGRWDIGYRDADGALQSLQATHLISSAPLRELVSDYLPAVSAKAIQAANKLKYRDFLIVVLILKDKEQFDDNWIYIHDPAVDVGRIQNFKSWSPEMVPDPTMCCYGMEYFCFEGDGIWASDDAALIAKATRELIHIGLASEHEVVDGCVVRQPKAYPVYDDAYKENVEVVRAALESEFPTLHLVGRNGMHKYNNQDHAMMTAMLTVKNIMAGRQDYDVWNVNQDAEYHEAGRAGEVTLGKSLRSVPQRVKENECST